MRVELKKHLDVDVLDEDQINFIQERRLINSFDTATIPLWKNFQRCKSLLEAGIPAIKYNYSNDKSRAIILRLTHDGSQLSYESSLAPSGLLDRLKRRTKSVKLDNFISLVYGGQSATFKQHRDKNFQQFCYKTSSELTPRSNKNNENSQQGIVLQ